MTENRGKGMPGLIQKDCLEINEDNEFQKKEWSWARWGWILMLIIAAAGLLGLFGQGPFSYATARADGIEVEYERFERLLAPAQIEVKLTQQDFQNREARVQVSRKMLNMYNLQRIVPEPDQSILSDDMITYVFKVDQARQPRQITFDLQPNHIGQVNGRIGLENGQPVQFTQFVYP